MDQHSLLCKVGKIALDLAIWLQYLLIDQKILTYEDKICILSLHSCMYIFAPFGRSSVTTHLDQYSELEMDCKGCKQ